MEKIIKKQVGQKKKENPLERLRKVNLALQKLGCNFDKPDRTYRKVVGHRKRNPIDVLALKKIMEDQKNT
ncbi:MAG TPA: hypothetical protein ENI73_02440 [Spirochaetes bacterium]|nr:hypothetical protein [Spirochaetota bacterium]